MLVGSAALYEKLSKAAWRQLLLVAIRIQASTELRRVSGREGPAPCLDYLRLLHIPTPRGNEDH